MVLGRVISHRVIEVDKAKIEVIKLSTSHLCERGEKLPWTRGFLPPFHQRFLDNYKISHFTFGQRYPI